MKHYAYHSFLLLVVICLSSCASSYQSTPAINTIYKTENASLLETISRSESDLEGVKIDQKIIKDGDIHLKVLYPDSILSDLSV